MIQISNTVVLQLRMHTTPHPLTLQTPARPPTNPPRLLLMAAFARARVCPGPFRAPFLLFIFLVLIFDAFVVLLRGDLKCCNFVNCKQHLYFLISRLCNCVGLPRTPAHCLGRRSHHFPPKRVPAARRACARISAAPVHGHPPTECATRAGRTPARLS